MEKATIQENASLGVFFPKPRLGARTVCLHPTVDAIAVAVAVAIDSEDYVARGEFEYYVCHNRICTCWGLHVCVRVVIGRGRGRAGLHL